MKNRIIKLTALLLALTLMLGISLAACSDKSEQESIETETDAPFVPAVDNGEESELYERYAEYEENASLAFKSYSPVDKDAFSYEKADGAVKIVKYVGDESIVIIPDTIDGAEVTELSEAAFADSPVRAVYIPDTVKKIGKGAFANCTSLSTLRVPFVGDGGENGFIGYIFGANEPDANAVALPPSLDMIIVGEGSESIADEAFKGAKTLSAVVLSDNVKKIGKLAFYQCVDLVYFSFGGVVEIDEYAFAYCKALYNIDISSVTNITKGAFYSCTALNSITLSLSKGDYLGRIFGADSPEYNDELVPQSLRKVTVAEGCKNIPARAFYSCQYLTEVNLPNSLESVGIRALYACRSLVKVTIPDNVRIICDDAFFGCDNLSELTLGSSLEIISMQAFFGCEELKSVKIPKSLKEIRASAFYGCKSLVYVDMSEITNGVIIASDAFYNCPRLSPVDYSRATVNDEYFK